MRTWQNKEIIQEVRIKPKNIMMYQDIHNCICQNTKKNEDILSIMSNLQTNCCLKVTMNAMASQITSISIFCSAVCSDAHQRKHQSSALLAFVRVIRRWPVDSPRKGPVTRKMFPFDDVIMFLITGSLRAEFTSHWWVLFKKGQWCGNLLFS